MANEEHLAMLRQGVDVWNEWRKENISLRPNLEGVNLFEAELREADLKEVNLSRADLQRADLKEANLSRADLRRANLFEANLSGADLRRANLRSAVLSWVVLTEAYLNWANLSGAFLTGAYLGGTDLRGATLSRTVFNQAVMIEAIIERVDLSTAKGLETVKHQGPSTIGIRAIYGSQGKIPDVFLRGAGVPDNFITYMHSLTSEAIQYHSCFISYSSKDEGFAQRLYADLQAKGVRCWFAPHDMAGGEKVHEQIEQAVQVHDKLLIVLSENSMASEWVKTEIYHARQQEVEENRRKLFPISLVTFETIRQWKAFDVDIGKDMAREVREYFIPDFSLWEQHSHYQKAFDRLMKDLRAEAS